MEQHLSRLRRAIAKNEALPEAARSIPLGVTQIDRALGGGLAGAALHEFCADAPMHVGATAGFALILARLARVPGQQTLLITTDLGLRENGALYGPGLDALGLRTDLLLIARVARPVDALFAMEEALKCRALSAVVAELGEAPSLTDTRRLLLAAKDNGGIGLMMRGKRDGAPSAAHTRWHIASAPSVPDEFGGLGRTAFALTLTRNRRGPCGAWTLAWDHHEHVFETLSVGVAETTADRPAARRTG
jgi:protein ImuA